MNKKDIQLNQVIQATVFLFLFLLLGGLLLIVYPTLSRENFTNFNYANCIAQGYSKEFCIQRPQLYGSDICTCSNGMVGKKLPGFGGECVCSPLEMDKSVENNISGYSPAMF